MFDSGVSAKKFIEQIKNEADIAIPISNAAYVMWLNVIEQLLYTEYIKEQGIEKVLPSGNTVNIQTILGTNYRFEDVYAVYADDVQLIKSTAASGNIFPDTFYNFNDRLYINRKTKINKLEIVYFVKPSLKTVDDADNIGEGNVMLPIEFVPLAAAYIRGEAYKAANEDAIAAKWINDYNVLLETFKAWLDAKRSNFGL